MTTPQPAPTFASTMKKYIEIDSTYRNRTLFPNPADFEVYNHTNYENNHLNAQDSIDPVSGENTLYPPENTPPVAYYEEYLYEPTIPLGTITQRGYLPYMFSDSNNQIFIDELPISPTTPNLSESDNTIAQETLLLTQADNAYNNKYLENINTGEIKRIISSNYIPGTIVLQQLIIKSYFISSQGPSISVFGSSPNSLPPSNVDRFYQGKYIQTSTASTNILILNYSINSNAEGVFLLESTISPEPPEGTLINIIGLYKTVLNIETPFLSALSAYPAYRFPPPLNPSYTGIVSKQNKHINTTTSEILYISAQKTPNTFGIAFITNSGLNTANYPTAKLYYMSSDDGNIFRLETLVDTTRIPTTFITDPIVGLQAVVLDDGLPGICINTIPSSTSDGSDYNVQFTHSQNEIGTNWTTLTGTSVLHKIIVDPLDGPVEIQYRTGYSTSNSIQMIRTSGPATSNIFYDYSNDPHGDGLWTEIDLTSVVGTPYPQKAITQDMILNSQTGGPMFIYYDGSVEFQLQFVYSISSNPTIAGDFFNVFFDLPESLGQASLAMVLGIFPPFIPDAGFVVPAFAFVGKTSNSIFFINAIDSLGDSWTNEFHLVTSEAGDSKIVKLVVINSFPTIIFQSNDGIRLITASGWDSVSGEYLWDNLSVLLVYETGITAMDVVMKPDGFPYVVYNSGSSKNILNTLSLSSVPIVVGAEYRIRDGAPLLSGNEIVSGSLFNAVLPPLTNPLGISALANIQPRNSYLWIYNRNWVDYGQSTFYGDTLDFTNSIFSLAQVNGFPSLTYVDAYGLSLYFIINTKINGTGEWTKNLVSADLIRNPQLNSKPSISAYDITRSAFVFFNNTEIDGSGVWNSFDIALTDGTQTIYSNALVDVGDGGEYPGVFYYDGSGGLNNLFFASNNHPDGSGVWTISLVDGTLTNPLGDMSSVMVDVDDLGVLYPAVVYSVDTENIKYAINSLPDGSGTWSVNTITSSLDSYYFPSIAIINEFPAVAYYNPSNLVFSINSQTDGLGIWTNTTLYPSSPKLGKTQLLFVDNSPIIIYHASNNTISYTKNTFSDATGVWDIPVILENLQRFNENVLRAIVFSDMTGGGIVGYATNTSLSRIIFKYGIFHTFGTNPVVINDLRLIDSVSVGVGGGGTTIIVTEPFSAPLDVSFDQQYSWNILTWDTDNFSALDFIGTYTDEDVCYELELQRLTLPNVTLASGVGNRIAFYPYIYVEFEMLNNPLTNIITSNNSTATKAIFTFPIYNVNAPTSASFVVLGGQNIRQTIKFRPGLNYRFKVRLPDGDIFTTQQTDTLPPVPPNFNLQISAVFGYRRLT